MMIVSVFTALPVTVSAEETDNVAKIGSTKYTTLESAVAAAKTGEEIRLMKDVTLKETLVISKEITIDLDGYGITKNGNHVIRIISEGDLTLDDSNVTIQHYFNVSDGKAVNINNTSGAYSFAGGYITGGTGCQYNEYFWSEGGGVYVDGGKFTMNGGTILGNSAAHGGGVCIYSGEMTMNRGTVCYNTASEGGSGIGFRTGSSSFNRDHIVEKAVFSMHTGAAVKNNNKDCVATCQYSYGSDEANIHGGTIADNGGTGLYSKSLQFYGNVTVTGNDVGVSFGDECTLWGNPVIENNNYKNFFVPDDKKIEIKGKLNDADNSGNVASVGISMNNAGVFTSSYNTYCYDVDPSGFFKSDDTEKYVIRANEYGEAELKNVYWTASYKPGDGSGSMTPSYVTKGESFQLPECTLSPPEGQSFLCWSDGTNTYKAGDTVTMTEDTDYTAQWAVMYDITWKDWDGSIIDTTKELEGVVPTHADPTRKPDDNNSYIFTVWNPTPAAVTGDAEYTATYKTIPRTHSVIVEDIKSGTVTADPGEAAKDDPVTLTVQPGTNAQLGEIKAFKKGYIENVNLTAVNGSGGNDNEKHEKLVDGNTNTKWCYESTAGYIIV